MPITTTLDIVCTDADGETDTKPITITVSPINEFDPEDVIPTNMEVNVRAQR